MGVACKIVRGSNNEITSVKAVNGKESALYRQALSYTKNPQKALDIWGTAYTDEFKRLNGDWMHKQGSLLDVDENGEPKLRDVLGFLKYHRHQKAPLTRKDRGQLLQSLLSTPINTTEELYTKLRNTFYSGGVFNFNRKALLSEGIYSEVEVSNIMGNSKLQSKIKNFVEKLEVAYIRGDLDVGASNLFSEEELLFDYSATTALGTLLPVNPLEVRSTIYNKVAGIKNRLRFEEALMELPYQALITKYKNDLSFADAFYNKYSSYKRTPILSERNGELVKKNTDDTTNVLRSNFLSKGNVIPVLESVYFLTNVDELTWEDNIDDIKVLLKDLERQVLPFNIDIIGVSDTFAVHTKQELDAFLESLGAVLRDVQTQKVDNTHLNALGAYINRYVGKGGTVENSFHLVSERDSQKPLLDIETTSSELELYQKYSMIRTSDGLYHQVGKIGTESLYEVAYQTVINDSTRLPKEAYYPTAFNTSNNFDVSLLVKEENHSKVVQNIKQYINKQLYKSIDNVSSDNMADFEQLVLLKELFQYSKEAQPSLNIVDSFARAKEFKGDFDYLTNQFPKAFYQYILNNKYKGNDLYTNVLSNFRVDERGITLKELHPYLKEQIRLLDAQDVFMKALKDYSLISKDAILRDLFEYKKGDELLEQTVEGELTDFQTIYYMNNPQVLPLFKERYKLDSDLLVTSGTVADFIRTKEGVFQKIDSKGSATFYRQLPTLKQSRFNNYSLKVSVSDKIDYTKYIEFMQDTFADVEVRKMYKGLEEQRIKNKIDDC